MTETARPPSYARWLPVVLMANVVTPLAMAVVAYLYFTGAFEPEPEIPMPLDSPLAFLPVPGTDTRLVFNVGDGWRRLEGGERSVALEMMRDQGSAVSRRVGGAELDFPKGAQLHRHRDNAVLTTIAIGAEQILHVAGIRLSQRARSLTNEGFVVELDEERSIGDTSCYFTTVRRDELQIQSAVCRPHDYYESLVSFALMQTKAGAPLPPLEKIAGTLRLDDSRTP